VFFYPISAKNEEMIKKKKMNDLARGR